jgi:hypothetical protein
MMRSASNVNGLTSSSSTRSALPLRLFTRVPLFPELAEAIGAALDAQERQTERGAREALVLRTHAALEAWLDGGMSDAQVVRALRLALEAAAKLA